MKKLLCILLATFFCDTIMSGDLRPCNKYTDCNDDEICVLYNGCNGQPIKRCLPRACYRSGVGCPSDIVCNDKHCSVLGCKS